MLQQNKRAIALYHRLGFSITRDFVVLMGSDSKVTWHPKQVQYASFSKFDFPCVTDLRQNKPSYEHSDYILKQHPARYTAAYIKEQNSSAWCVFSKATGQILQFAWSDTEVLREVVQALLMRYPHATVKNIDSSEQKLLEILKELQFKVVAKQYEMVRNISDDSTLPNHFVKFSLPRP